MKKTSEEKERIVEASRHQEIMALAQRLAQREGVNPTWIDYPAWSGIPLGAEAVLKKAAPGAQGTSAVRHTAECERGYSNPWFGSLATEE